MLTPVAAQPEIDSVSQPLLTRSRAVEVVVVGVLVQSTVYQTVYNHSITDLFLFVI